MVKKEIYSRVVKLGDGLAFSIPPEMYTDTTLEEGKDIRIVINERGNLEAQVNKVIKKEVKCRVCTINLAKYQCTLCKAWVCPDCFMKWGGLCKNCTGGE